MKKLLCVVMVVGLLLGGCSVLCQNPEWVKADLDVTINQLDAVILALMELPFPESGIPVVVGGVTVVVTQEMAASTIKTGKALLVGLKALYAKACPDVVEVEATTTKAHALLIHPAARLGMQLARMKGRLP